MADKLNVTQLSIEIVGCLSNLINVSQVSIEMLNLPRNKVDITQMCIELMVNPASSQPIMPPYVDVIGVFHRYYVDLDVNFGGSDSDIKKIRIGYDPNTQRQ